MQIGDRLGDYRLVRELGRGTFGTVYLAEHIYVGRQDAIKVITHLALDARQELLAEARKIAAWHHPNIVLVHNFSEYQNMPYLVMQYASNGTLQARYPLGQAFPIQTILPHVQQTAAGLQYAHDQQMLHLDLKPANVLLDDHQRALISDFGISVVLQPNKTYMTVLQFTGTPAYAAPEQFDEEHGHATPATDQYALATMVYQWLTGRLPFTGSFLAVGMQKNSKDPPPLGAGVAPAVEAVVLRALKKDPKDRYASVTEFAEALERAQQARPALSAAPAAQPQQPPLFPLPKVAANPVVVNPAAAPQQAPAAEKKPEPPVRQPPYVAPQAPASAPAKAPEPAQRPVAAPKVAVSAKSKRMEFRRVKVRAAAFSVGSCFFFLMAGLGAIVGTNTQSWPLAVGVVAVVFVLAYTGGYRKALPPLASLEIAIVSAALVYALTVFLSGYDYGQVQTSHLWFDATRHLTLRSQIIAGAFVGGICSLCGFLVYVDNRDGFNTNFWLGLFIAAFGFGAILWLIVTALSSLVDLGFGFGYGWNFNLLCGWAVTIIGGFGLCASTYIWREGRHF